MSSKRKQLQKERLQLYLDAEAAVLAGQSYTIRDRTLTRANLAEIREAIDDLLEDGALDGENEGRGRTGRVIFVD